MSGRKTTADKLREKISTLYPNWDPADNLIHMAKGNFEAVSETAPLADANQQLSTQFRAIDKLTNLLYPDDNAKKVELSGPDGAPLETRHTHESLAELLRNAAAERAGGHVVCGEVADGAGKTEPDPA